MGEGAVKGRIGVPGNFLLLQYRLLCAYKLMKPKKLFLAWKNFLNFFQLQPPNLSFFKFWLKRIRAKILKKNVIKRCSINLKNIISKLCKAIINIKKINKTFKRAFSGAIIRRWGCWFFQRCLSYMSTTYRKIAQIDP